MLLCIIGRLLIQMDGLVAYDQSEQNTLLNRNQKYNNDFRNKEMGSLL